jgi:hypothetical protein
MYVGVYLHVISIYCELNQYLFRNIILQSDEDETQSATTTTTSSLMTRLRSLRHLISINITHLVSQHIIYEQTVNTELIL